MEKVPLSFVCKCLYEYCHALDGTSFVTVDGGYDIDGRLTIGGGDPCLLGIVGVFYRLSLE